MSYYITKYLWHKQAQVSNKLYISDEKTNTCANSKSIGTKAHSSTLPS